MCSSERTASLIYVGPHVIVFPQTKHFPMWNEVWALLIQSVKLSSRFSWRGHQEHKAHRKHIQVLTPIELIMTTQLPLRLDTPFFLNSTPCTWLWLLWFLTSTDSTFMLNQSVFSYPQFLVTNAWISKRWAQSSSAPALFLLITHSFTILCFRQN